MFYMLYFPRELSSLEASVKIGFFCLSLSDWRDTGNAHGQRLGLLKFYNIIIYNTTPITFCEIYVFCFNALYVSEIHKSYKGSNRLELG